MIIDANFALEVVIDDIVDTSNPMRVARINQFVSSSVETSEFDLPLREPMH